MDYNYHDENLKISAISAPWDAAVLGFPVVCITELTIFSSVNLAAYSIKHFMDWLQSNKVGFVSCRIPCAKFSESVLLQQLNFIHIEYVLHPILRNVKNYSLGHNSLKVLLASEIDIDPIKEAANKVFQNERFYIDARLNSGLAGVRYANWVASAFNSSTQQVFKIVDESKIVAFFIIEISGNSCYWHLTAVMPDLQGRNYGYQSWTAMIGYLKNIGVDVIKTTIAARNTSVLNLYSKLSFRFEDPDMTFHYLASEVLC